LKPTFVDCDDVSIEFQWLILPQYAYVVQYKAVGDDEQDWNERVLVPSTRCPALAETSIGAASVVSDVGSYRLGGLCPKTTYELRVVARSDAAGLLPGEDRSDPSEALTVDTQAKLGWLDRLLRASKRCFTDLSY
jgi:hypothetical protein